MNKNLKTAVFLLMSNLFGLASAETVTVIDPSIITDRTRAVEFTPYAYQPIETRQSSTPSGTFNANVIFLADQLDRNRDAEANLKPILVTSFSNLDNLSETTSLGRLLGEQLIHELKVRGWQVVDLRLTKSVIVNQSGEFSLSRELSRIRESFPAGNVLVGTYSRTTDGVLLSARIIDVASGHVQSSAQSRAPRDRFVNNLVSLPVTYPTVRVSN
jgi:TolB-like protein